MDALKIPLAVDLDGTLLKGDVFLEGCLGLARAKPAGLIRLLGAAFKGRLAAKELVSAHSAAAALSLPADARVLGLIEKARAGGRPVFLATAAVRQAAEAAAGRLGLFDGVFASEKGLNLKGEAKAALLAEKFGDQGFDYVGDGPADLPVWRRARHAYMAGGGNPAAIRKSGRPFTVLERAYKPLLFFQALRARQWLKNMLLAVPLVLAHRTAAADVLAALAAFASFSACASGVYILNDLHDLPHDRSHPLKKKRPFASGEIPVSRAPFMLLGALGLAAAPCLFLPAPFAATLAIYFLANLLYTVGLKTRLFLDVLFLAGLYVLRIVAGSQVLGLEPSNWLLTFSLFIFLGLALIKRSGELKLRARSAALHGVTPDSGRAYKAEDAAILDMMAAAASLLSVLALCLYIDSPRAVALYSRPTYLWALCPILLFYVGRLLLLAHRGALDDDPFNFTVTDRPSLVCAALSLFALLLAA